MQLLANKSSQVLKPLVETLYLLGTSINATISTLLVPSNTENPHQSEAFRENSIANLPMLCLLWYHPFVANQSASQDATPKQSDPPQKQKLRPHFLSHARRDSHSHLSSDKGQQRVRSFSNPQLRLAIPTSTISSSSIQFMGCKSLRHALMLVSSRMYSVRSRDDFPSPSNPPAHRPHSPNTVVPPANPPSYSPSNPSSYNPSPSPIPSTYNLSLQPSPASCRPGSPNVDRRHSAQPSISQHVIGNLEPVQKQVVDLIVGLLESGNSTGNDDRLIVCYHICSKVV